MPAIKCGLWLPGCYLHGQFIATQTLIGQGKIGSFDDSEYTRWADFDLNLDVHWIGGDFGKPGAKIEASLPCEGTWAPGNSTAIQERACYFGVYESREDSPTGGKTDGDTKLDLWSTTPTLPNVAVGDQVAVGKFTPKLDFTLPGYRQLISSEGEEGKVRFDSAVYNPWAKTGSVFPDATPSLRYDKSDTSDAGLPTPYTGVEAVARHIDEARKDPDASYPDKTGKNLPGESPLHPLHRITASADAASKQRYEANDTVRKLDCNASTPGAPAAGKDCDEYPFRSSAEGAARYQYEGAEFKDDFSVRYIDPKEDQEAGARLGAWYHSDRVASTSEEPSRGEVKGPPSGLNTHCHRIRYLASRGKHRSIAAPPPTVNVRKEPGSASEESAASRRHRREGPAGAPGSRQPPLVRPDPR